MQEQPKQELQLGRLEQSKMEQREKQEATSLIEWKLQRHVLLKLGKQHESFLFLLGNWTSHNRRGLQTLEEDDVPSSLMTMMTKKVQRKQRLCWSEVDQRFGLGRHNTCLPRRELLLRTLPLSGQ